MKQLLLFFAILAPFVPDVGQAAGLGRLAAASAADKLLVPATVIVWLIARSLPPTPMERFGRILLVFLLFALVASLSIPFRFPTAAPAAAVMGVLRMAKFSGYVLLAFGSLRCFASPRYRETVLRSWGFGVVLMSSVLVYQALILDAGMRELNRSDLLRGNPTSVALACVVVSGLSVMFSDTLRNRRTWVLGTVILVGIVGMIFSQGRGGWVALLIGGAFLIRKFSARSILAVMTLSVVVVAAAANSTSVARNLRALIVEDQGYSAGGDDAEASFDDAGRIQTWVHEGAKLADHPLLGFGVFHRGGASPLWSTGSHNFFLQMFLETGLFGGGAFLWFVWSIWRGANTLKTEPRTGVRAVLLAMVSGGLGGEYFYGDAPLYCFLIALWMLAIPAELGAPRVATPDRASVRRRRSGQRRRSESTNSERSGMPASASASEPPSPRSTTQSAPST